MSRLERFRENKNKFFATHENSPLRPEQKERFQTLQYFPEDEKLHIEVKLDEEGVDPAPLTLGTTTGEPKEFSPAGRAHFQVDGQPVTLMVFKEPGRGRLFLPFRDGTAGKETYAVGRYLDPQTKPDGTVILNFNYAYSPYCAYNDDWTCPIPPFENIVQVEIRAGEKSYPDKV